jgi:hypothetical protein
MLKMLSAFSGMVTPEIFAIGGVSETDPSCCCLGNRKRLTITGRIDPINGNYNLLHLSVADET